MNKPRLAAGGLRRYDGPVLTIDTERFLQDFEDLARLGATPAGGVHRPALSEADLQARAWFRDRAEAAGLKVHQDGAGNLSARLPCARPGAKTLLAGSHLDSVPGGGRFDGALGVVCALEALRTVKDSGLELPIHLEAISFTDEEGTWLGLLGSRAFAGTLRPEDLQAVPGGLEALDEALARIGTDYEALLAARRDPAAYAGFVEVHIEQGRRLEAAAVPVGVVEAVVGIRWHRLRFVGQAGHAGTLPLEDRRDALWGAARFVERAPALVRERFSPGVMNCGRLHVAPGAFNIVPGQVELALECRHGSEAQLDALEAELLNLAARCAQELNLDFEHEAVSRVPAAPLDTGVMSAIEAAAEALNLAHVRLLSFAGHDTQALSAVLPAGMFFVPSIEGISHSPREFTREEDLIHAANVLLGTLLRLAAQET